MDTTRTTAQAAHHERLQLHYAARLLASTAHALCEHAADDSHSALHVTPDGAAIHTQALNDDGLVLELRLDALTLRWCAASTPPFALIDATIADAYHWLNATRPAGTPPIHERQFPDFPAHALAHGAPFRAAHADERTALGHTFAMAQRIFAMLSDSTVATDVSAPAATRASDTFSPIRLWPHHFDLGLLITLDAPDQIIGVGLSAGDTSYDEPYFYVSRYPRPSTDDAPPPWKYAGHWHTDGFRALVLTESEWRHVGGNARDVAAAFVRKAVSHSR